MACEYPVDQPATVPVLVLVLGTIVSNPHLIRYIDEDHRDFVLVPIPSESGDTEIVIVGQVHIVDKRFEDTITGSVDGVDARAYMERLLNGEITSPHSTAGNYVYDTDEVYSRKVLVREIQ